MKCIKTCSNVLQYIKMYCNILQCIKMCCNVLRMTGIKASSWEGWKGSWLASKERSCVISTVLSILQVSSDFNCLFFWHMYTSFANYSYKSWEIFLLHWLCKRLWQKRGLASCQVCVSFLIEALHCMKTIQWDGSEKPVFVQSISKVVSVQCQQQLNCL